MLCICITTLNPELRLSSVLHCLSHPHHLCPPSSPFVYSGSGKKTGGGRYNTRSGGLRRQQQPAEEEEEALNALGVPSFHGLARSPPHPSSPPSSLLAMMGGTPAAAAAAAPNSFAECLEMTFSAMTGSKRTPRDQRSARRTSVLEGAGPGEERRKTTLFDRMGR